uniref:Uncharacterized protein n=1 Tax=Arundo donax TaxID=35708 RepID=A0A0A8YKS3_ARUDO
MRKRTPALFIKWNYIGPIDS